MLNIKQNVTIKILAISLIALFAISMLAPLTFAQVGVPQPEKTTGYISVAPLLVGVNQEATVNLWLFPLPSTYIYSPYFKGFNRITVTFLKPDGTKDTFMPTDGTGQYVAGETEATGSLYFTYAPNMAGNWSVTFSMPAQNITDNTGTVQYMACTSNTAYFTVQTDPVNAGLLNGYPWSQLPNSNVYWSYPINSNNREWSAISGDWLGVSSVAATVNSANQLRWQPYGSGPNTAHVVWDQPTALGGLVGGDYGGLSTYVRFYNFVVMGGKAFVNIPNAGQFECIDMSTGNILYKASGSVTYGIHLPGNTYAQASYDASVTLASSYGQYPTSYLFGTSGTTWNFYDPPTGTLMRSIVNASTSSYRLIDGSNLAYGTTSSNLFAWNISRVVNNNWPTGITWTRPLPASLTSGSVAYAGNGIPSLFGLTTDQSTIVLRTTNQYWGYSTTDGTSLWNLTLTYPVEANTAFSLYGVNDFIVFDPIAATFNCYSMTSGTLLWISPSFSSSPWATTWQVYNSVTNDYNSVYLALPDGTITALSLATGKEVWRSEAIPSTEYTNNAVPYIMGGLVMVGGNIYCYAGYSTLYQLDPTPRFAMLVCVNATTGNITYTLNGGVIPLAAADGYVTGYGDNDGNIYCVGKGTTSTLVMAQQQVGGSVLIQGSVLDKSPASSSATLAAIYPNGVPAISDANMSAWMDYLHMQNSTLLNSPPNCNGVPVTLTAVDPNGNAITIGTATSDSSGTFAYQWTPTITGLYKIYATFAGSNSYYSSFAETHATMASTTTSSPAPTSTEQASVTNSDMLTYFAVGIVVIIIAIAVATVLNLRKK